MKKLYAAFLPVLAIAAFAVLPAVAQAQPHWYSNGVKIAAGTKVKVTTHGTLAFSLSGATVTCKLTDTGLVENPASGSAGIDSIETFVVKECVVEPSLCAAGEAFELTAGKLPWATVLLPGPPIRDEIKGIELKLECNKRLLDVFTGNLTPKFVNSGTPKTCSGATDSFVEFDAPGSGFLVDPLGNKLILSGKDFIEGPAGDRCITVKNP